MSETPAPIPARFCSNERSTATAPIPVLTEHRQREANLRGKTYRHFDTAGVLTTDRYDFKGNLLHSYRQFAKDYKTRPGLVAGAGARQPRCLSIAPPMTHSTG